MNFSDQDILARTIYGEARGDGFDSMLGVANVVVNRLKTPRRFGGCIREVCLKPYQFSCWLKKDLNYPVVSCTNIEDALFEMSSRIAYEVMSGELPDNTDGANHYYSSIISPPYWADEMFFTVQWGQHRFFNLHA